MLDAEIAAYDKAVSVVLNRAEKQGIHLTETDISWSLLGILHESGAEAMLDAAQNQPIHDPRRKKYDMIHGY